MIKTIARYIKEHKILRSLQAQIFAIVFIIGIVTCVFLRHGYLKLFEEKSIESLKYETGNEMNVIATHIINQNKASFEADVISDNIKSEVTLISSIHGSRILVVDRDYKVIRDSYSVLSGKFWVNDGITTALMGEEFSMVNNSKKCIEMVIPVKNLGEIYGAIAVVIPLNQIDNSVKAYSQRTIIIEIIALVFIALLAFFFSSFISRRVSGLTKRIESVVSFEDGNISSSDYIETEGIVRAFNAQRMRLQALDDSRQEFVSNVSHELKTPITSIKVLAESLIFQENAPIEMYKDFMQDIVEEIDRENSIITDLLALVHMEKGKENLNVSVVNCIDMIELIIKRLTPIAKQNEVDIIFECDKEITAEIDEVKMTLAITNLVENGIKYNKKHGWVKVFLDANHQFVTIKIVDSGIGIPNEALPHIFERFYRVDKSHSREIGGTGLGLPLARKIVLLHRGSIKVESEINEGTTFIIKLPTTYVE